MSIKVTVQVKNPRVLNKMIRRLPLLPTFIAQQVTYYSADRLEATSREAAPVWRGTLKNSITQEVDKKIDGAEATIFSDQDYVEDLHQGFIPQAGLSNDPGKIVQLAQWRADKAKNIPLNRLIHSLEVYGIKNPKPFFHASWERFAFETGVFQGIATAAVRKAIAKL